MPRATVQDVPLQPFSQGSWAGGINTSTPAEHIANNEAQDILNLEYDRDDYLVTRSGTVYFHGLQPSLTYPDRFTSMHYFENDAGSVKLIYTSGAHIYSSNNTGTSVSEVTGALTLPADNFWQWVNYNGLAIGVNKATVGDNPVKYTGVGNATALGGTPPKGLYIEVWNDRVWIAKDSVLYGSKLGDPENWTDTTIDIGAVTLDVSKNDGDKITGLISFRNSLFIFKRNSIFVLSATTSPATASSRYRIDVYSKNVGCVSAYSIKPILDDVLFLSDNGVCALTAAAVVGDLSTAFLSRNIKALSTYLRTTMDISALVLSEVNQYWLFLPDYANPKTISEVYVLDYQKLQEGIPRWVRFEGRVAGNVASVNYINGARKYVIGVKETTTNYRPYLYVPKDISILTDAKGNANTAYSKRLLTRAYNCDVVLLRKLFHRFGLKYKTISQLLALTVQYYFDDYTPSGGIFTYNSSVVLAGGIWDAGLWDTAVWDAAQVIDLRIWQRFKEALGERRRKGVNITFLISNTQAEQGLVLQELEFHFAVLNERHVRNIN